MPTPIRRRLRLARRGAWYALVVVLVLMALAAGITSQLLPLAERHPDRIAAWLSARAQRPVAFDHVRTEWTRRGPLLRVDGLRVGEGAGAVPIGAAEILVAQYAGLLPGRSFTELRLRGLALTLERHDDGRWQVRGWPGQAQSQGDPLDALQALGELQVIGGRLTVLAPSIGIETTLSRVDLRLRVQGARVRAAARARVRAGASPLDGVLDFDRTTGDGRVYLAARQADLASWAPLLKAGGVVVDAGGGRLSLWTELRAHRITQVTLDADLRALRLQGAALAAADTASPNALQPLAFERVEARARWQVTEDGWRLDAPRLRLLGGAAAQPAILDGLALAGGAHRALLAERIDAAPLLAIAALSDRLPVRLRAWLHQARPGMILRDVVFSDRGDGPLTVRARVDGLGFAAVGSSPGVAGLSGTLQGDGEGVAFDFDARHAMRLDWPRAFVSPHDVKLRGRFVGWRAGDGWQVQAPALRIDGEGFGADVRGGLWFQGDGTLPAIALAAALDDTAIPVAKRFWVRHKMPPATVRWLDSALLGGRVRNGLALVSGDLDDWPFRDGSGLFRAEAELADATVKFQDEWPAAGNLDGHVVFEGDGFRIAGKAALANVAISRIEGGIAHFGRAELQVRADAAADAGALLALLRQGPLRKAHGETLQSLRASGPAAVTFALDLPLHGGAARPRIDGSVALRGAKLAETRWELAFADVRGQARYDRDGFTADDLKVVREGQPGALGLRAGASHVRDRSQAFEAELEASLTAAELLERAPELDWLMPYFQGRSPWTVAVSIPAAAANAGASVPAAAGRLQLRSSLVGTRLTLPAPLQKPALTALPTTVETRLPLGDGEITVSLGDRLALRARSQRGRTGVSVTLGGEAIVESPPASGLVVSGRTTALDAIGWATLAGGRWSGDEAGADGGLPLRRIDVAVEHLQLLGGVFPDTRIRALPAGGGTAIRFEGAALSGSLLLPQSDGAALAGRLQRLHWRSAKPASAAAANANGDDAIRTQAAGAAAEDSIDPARVPPLNLVVDDLRFGDARLGSAALQTRRTAAGMRIERLQTRAPGQRVDVSGDWLGRDAAARTRLQVALDSEDFGALLAGFGFGGRIHGGHGEADFDAAWPGSPADFELGALEGSLALTIKDGSLVEIEPGAGRVLGLLSIAELPRRLTLDFRDFFARGFTFNRIAGHIRFAGGQARSDDLVIDGPAAEIRIRGAADLRAQTYDQTIEVLPRTSNLLTAVGAITGGPVGAAVGAVANAVLRKPLGEIGAKVYHVTGPWQDPRVEVAGREAEQASARGEPPG